MSEYKPDRWVIVRTHNDKKPFCKVLAGWYGGYLDGDSWRMSSPIESIEQNGDFYEISNSSGSKYLCHTDRNELTGVTAGIFDDLKENNSVKIISVGEYLEEFVDNNKEE
jgi:hypothetical protein